MSYGYGGPISSLINGLAALLSLFASYFSPVTSRKVVVGPSLVNQLVSSGKLGTFVETYGSLSLHTEHCKLLHEEAQEALRRYMDKGLAELTRADQETAELSKVLRRRLSEEESLILAQVLSYGDSLAFLGSREAKSAAVALGVRPLGYEEFVVEAYRRGLISPSEAMHTLGRSLEVA